LPFLYAALAGGWCENFAVFYRLPEAIAEHAIPAMSANFYKLDRSQDVFSWDPV